MPVTFHEEISWVYHPKHGTVSILEGCAHRKIFDKHDYLLVDHKDGEDVPYDPARGYIRVDRTKKILYFTNYNITNAPKADAINVDAHVRDEYQIPDDFSSVIVGNKSEWIYDRRTMNYERYIM